MTGKASGATMSFPHQPFTCLHPRPEGIHGGTSRRAWWQVGVGRNPAGVFDLEKCEPMVAPCPLTADTFARISPGSSRSSDARSLRYSSTLYFNAQIPNREPDFRLVLRRHKTGVLSYYAQFPWWLTVFTGLMIRTRPQRAHTEITGNSRTATAIHSSGSA